MNKKSLLTFGIIIGVLISIFIFYNNRTITIGQQNEFKKIYKGNNSIEDLDLYIINLATENNTKIDSKEDIKFIIEEIKNAKIKKISTDDVVLGGYARLQFVNNINNAKVEIYIGKEQVSIGNKNYATNENLLEKIKGLIKEYDPTSIM